MTDKFEHDLAERFRGLDQPIQIDAIELSSKLASIRNQRRRQRSRNRMLAVASLSCLVVLGFALQLLPSGGDSPSMSTNLIESTNEKKQVPFTLTEFDFPFDSTDQDAELNRLKEKLAALKRESKAQQLTLVRESISRTMFKNDSTLSLFE